MQPIAAKDHEFKSSCRCLKKKEDRKKLCAVNVLNLKKQKWQSFSFRIVHFTCYDISILDIEKKIKAEGKQK